MLLRLYETADTASQGNAACSIYAYRISSATLSCSPTSSLTTRQGPPGQTEGTMSYKSAPPQPVDIITYRHKEKLVYVKPADSYEVKHDVHIWQTHSLTSGPHDTHRLPLTSHRRNLRSSPTKTGTALASPSCPRLGRARDVQSASQNRLGPVQYPASCAERS